MAFYADTGQWPANNTDETTDPNPFTADDGTSGWDGPYLEKWPARAAWGGNYTFYDNAVTDWNDDAAGDDARYVEVTNIPDTAAARMDIQLDGAVDEDDGSIQYTDPNAATGDTIDVDFLVSID
jgi:general secretion pathway protein G